MMHIPAKFRENAAMRFRVTVRKLNMTDRRTDRRTGGRYNISRPWPSAQDKNVSKILCMIIVHTNTCATRETLVFFMEVYNCFHTSVVI